MSRMSSHNDWRTLYQEALHESDATILPARLEEAYVAVRGRLLELSTGSQPAQERRELDAAFYFLTLLRMVRPMEAKAPGRRLS